MSVICSRIRALHPSSPQRREHATGETVALFSPSFNASVSIETRREHLSADTGALVQRELMERSGIIEWLDERLDDPRNPDSTVYPMAELLRTHWLLLGQRWRSARNLSTTLTRITRLLHKR